MSAGGVNIAILVGRATSDPATRVVKGGVSQAIFGMTTREVWVDKQTDEKREKAIHHRVVVYGPLVRAVEKCVRRGSLVCVQGQIETRRWVGKDGTRPLWLKPLMRPTSETRKPPRDLSPYKSELSDVTWNTKISPRPSKSPERK